MTNCCRILIDLKHSRTQSPVDLSLGWGNYNYDKIHAPRRLFDHLFRNGYHYDTFNGSDLTFDLLKKYDIIYINLPDEKSPPFSQEEQDALHRYVSPERGGSLFIIADHTNCYYHAEKLNPFLERYQIRIEYASALEADENCIEPPAWISISRFDSSHPTNAGIKKISFQLGGVLQTSHATATLSKKGGISFWNPTQYPDFVGNWTPHKSGSNRPLPVVACRDTIGGEGGGKIAVVADQNIYGDVWAHYHDNFRHALNIFEWLNTNGCRGPTPLRETLPVGYNLFCDSFYSANAPGKAKDLSCFYSFWVNFNREYGFTAHAIDDPVFKNIEKSDGLFLFPLQQEITEDALNSLLSYKKTIIIMFDVTTATKETWNLVSKLAPDFSIENTRNNQTISCDKITQDVQQSLASHRVQMTTQFASSFLSVEQIQLQDFWFAPITSSWGSTFLRTKGYRKYDLARIKDNIIIFFQSNMFENRYLGTNEASQPNEKGLDAVRLQRSFIQYLKRDHFLQNYSHKH